MTIHEYIKKRKDIKIVELAKAMGIHNTSIHRKFKSHHWTINQLRILVDVLQQPMVAIVKNDIKWGR